MENEQRQFQLPLAELIDRLTVDQIKELLLENNKEDIASEINELEHDIDLIIKTKDIELSSHLIRIIIVLAQMNVHIWYNKDRMEEDPDGPNYMPLLKLSHQLNGIRNQMKNMLLAVTGDKDGATVRSNFNTDGLKGWQVSL